MITVVEAQESIREHTASLAPEEVPLASAQGRILREPVAAAEDMPAFDRSAMDGYAVRANDAAEEFELVGEIRAGQSSDQKIGPKQAIRILTGARLPGPGLKVIMQEHVELRDGKIRVTKRAAGDNVRKRGEDARAGEVLLEPGVTLDATALALLASIGKTPLLVSRQPRILHLTTGDEIVPPEQTPGEGQIRNSNAALIAALCREHGVDAVTHFHAGDELRALIETFAQAQADTFDLVLISGGSGQGAYDFTGELFKYLGATIHFREVNVRPGKPLIFGTGSSQIVFGLPGNALSHFVCFHLFVRQALDRLLARHQSTATRGFLAETMADTQNGRETWWPAEAGFAGGKLECRALPWKSSGDITRLPAANALIQVPASTSQLAKGTMVELLLTRTILF
jgi:molybdopterin molybdotransferase